MPTRHKPVPLIIQQNNIFYMCIGSDIINWTILIDLDMSSYRSAYEEKERRSARIHKINIIAYHMNKNIRVIVFTHDYFQENSILSYLRVIKTKSV